MKPIPRTRIRPKLGTAEFLSEVRREHGFLDPRSYVETRTGRVVLYGQDKTNLRRDVYVRCGGYCEAVNKRGKQCGKYAPWDGPGHGELAHVPHKGRGGSDTLEGVFWKCRACHKLDHPGLQWSSSANDGT